VTTLVHGYPAETARLFRAMGAASAMPSTARRALINATIVALKAAGIWAKLDALWLTAAAAQAAAVINWKSPGTHDLTPVNAPTFAADVGFTGDAVSMHLTIGSPSFTQFALNSATLFASVTGGTGVDAVIAPTGAGGNAWLVPHNGTNMTARINVASLTTIGAVANRNGRFVATRVDGANVSGYRNGSLVATVASAAAAVGTTNLALLRRNTVYANDTVRDAGIGAGLSGAEVADLETILNAYHAGL
jgi:hypothetical protein